MLNDKLSVHQSTQKFGARVEIVFDGEEHHQRRGTPSKAGKSRLKPLRFLVFDLPSLKAGYTICPALTLADAKKVIFYPFR